MQRELARRNQRVILGDQGGKWRKAGKRGVRLNVVEHVDLVRAIRARHVIKQQLVSWLRPLAPPPVAHGPCVGPKGQNLWYRVVFVLPDPAADGCIIRMEAAAAAG